MSKRYKREHPVSRLKMLVLTITLRNDSFLDHATLMWAILDAGPLLNIILIQNRVWKNVSDSKDIFAFIFSFLISPES